MKRKFYSAAIRKKAEDLFHTHHRSGSALMATDFTSLPAKAQEPWLQAAQKMMGETM
jgi:hypothetical protein